MTKRYRWPKTVRLYGPNEFCDLQLHRGNDLNTCCMLGWAAHVFGHVSFRNLDGPSYCEASAFVSLPDRVVNALLETMPHISFHGGNWDKIAHTSDSIKPKERAAWWKKFVAKLGYTEIT